MKTSLVILIFGVVCSIFFLSTGSASVISCPPNSYYNPDVNPKISQLCMAIEQVLSESSPQNDRFLSRLVDERNANLNAKRQDVDHVFLRFGRSGL
ncbi:myosuppressin-like [Rhynchophorus ferrugineus]|uniref:Myosuppressin-like protein n=1 Tax=Rhynchophorus ferrugineus TaxID=354439 RepID=A0A5Q0TX13_RHYFE|nr:hypothetical protein GWI33_003366 [Rhynchophorus ferrugineus]QGA72562.1 myosuppressin-like protein [Rhynchophorus ferrugineus]